MGKADFVTAREHPGSAILGQNVALIRIAAELVSSVHEVEEHLPYNKVSIPVAHPCMQLAHKGGRESQMDVVLRFDNLFDDLTGKRYLKTVQDG